MKSISSIVASGLLLVNFSVQARDGHRGGNGGNSIASHFSTIARNVQMVWEDICINDKDPEGFCNYVNDFAGLLDKDTSEYVLVKGEKNPEQVRAYDGEIREAINYKSPAEIIVNESAWKDMETDPSVNTRRLNLVMHEYLTFIGLDGSDHYDFSSAIYGMLVRKGYRLDKLTSLEGLASPCSLSINGHIESETYNQFQKSLIKKGYLIKNKNEETRYELEIMTACADKTATNSCAMHAQLKDTYTDSISVNEFVIDSSIAFSKRSKILKKLSEEILNMFPPRKCSNN